MRVSCVIATYKQDKEVLLSAIRSVTIQDYNEIELVVTDDGTEDFNPEFIYKYIDKIGKGNITVLKVLCNKENVGTVKNLNNALNNCTGEIIIPLASDDQFYDDKVITRIVNRFIETGCNVLVCSRLKCDDDMKTKIRLMPHPGYVKYINKHMSTAEEQFKNVALGRAYEFASGSAMYYKRSFIKSVGLYDDKYRLWEDGPFIARTVRNGETIKTAYDIVSVLYRSGGISDKNSKRQKTRTQSLIRMDYQKQIKREFLLYPKRFNRIHYNIIKGHYYLKMNNDKGGLVYALKYPFAYANDMYVRAKKVVMRVMG